MKKLEGKEKQAQIGIRLPQSLYNKLKIDAAKDGSSLNSHCVYLLSINSGKS